MKIGMLYPRISHYREEFFEEIMKNHNVDFFLYESNKESEKENFKSSYIKSNYLKTFSFLRKIRIINIFPILKNKYDVLILIGEMRSLSVWLLLFIYKFTNTKTILWGHGISIHTYLDEERKLHPLRVLFHKLADHNWLYTDNEVSIWKSYIDERKLTYLNNTINIEEILSSDKTFDKVLLKNKYKINTKINFIFAARFTNQYRRIDLMLELIRRVDKNKYGFIIIGDGSLKPDFSSFSNVYDFGAVYERNIKNELFEIADIYFQPAWMGLSTNEALAYGKMVLTFERSSEIRQCVEYSYLNKNNSYIVKDMQDLISFVLNIDSIDLDSYSKSAKEYAENNLTMKTMVYNALSSLEKIENS